MTGYLCLAFTHLSSMSQDAFSHAWLYPRILFAYWMSHLLFPASLICQSALIDRCCVHIVHKRFSLPWNLPISLCWLARELRGSFFSTSHLCSDYRWALSFLALYVGAGDQAQVLTLIGHALSGPSHLSSPSCYVLKAYWLSETQLWGMEHCFLCSCPSSLLFSPPGDQKAAIAMASKDAGKVPGRPGCLITRLKLHSPALRWSWLTWPEEERRKKIETRGAVVMLTNDQALSITTT